MIGRSRVAGSIRVAAGLLLAWALCATPVVSAGGAPLRPGPWRAWVDTPGGPLPFGLEIRTEGGGIRAAFLNGAEIFPVSIVRQEGRSIVFEIEQYGSYIRARSSANGTRLDGRWRRRWGVDEWMGLAFHATAGEAPRFEPETGEAPEPAPASTSDAGGIDGRWRVKFDSRGTESVGVFDTRPDGTVQGTFLNSTGDYRFLAGSFERGRLRLSRFDGAHAFLFDARLGDGGTLAGMFWEGNYHETAWTARRDDGARLADALGEFTIRGPVGLAEVMAVDLDGRDWSLADPRLTGRALVVEILGTWCPNCHDASAFLKDLYERYHERGLSVVGLAFEFSADFEQNARLLRRYRDAHAIPYPLLLAWSDEPRSPSMVFPTVQGPYAFPTLLFLRGDGSVEEIHTGFTSAASAEDHARLRERLESVVRELLSGEEAPPEVPAAAASP